MSEEPRTEAGKRLDTAWPGTHLDRLDWNDAIRAIEAEAIEPMLALVRAAQEAARHHAIKGDTCSPHSGCGLAALKRELRDLPAAIRAAAKP